MRAVHHIDGDATNNDPANLKLVGTDDNARTLSPADIRTLGLLLQRCGIVAVMAAIADLTELGVGVR
jgi:hypothetical protein